LGIRKYLPWFNWSTWLIAGRLPPTQNPSSVILDEAIFHLSWRRFGCW
jgi:hypothetical protein